MSKRPKSPSNKPKTVAKKRADLRRSTQRSIFPAQVLSPDQQLQLGIKTLAARQLRLIEEQPELSDPAAVARFLKDVSVALKNVQEMERTSQEDLSHMTDEELEAMAEAAEVREREANERLMKALPRGKAEREESE